MRLAGAGIGLRRPHIPALQRQLPQTIDFVELAPENWLEVGGIRAKELNFIHAHYPFICHGLSLSLGSPDPLDEAFLLRIKKFLHDYDVAIYSEHLSFCSAQGQLYDLLPLPFTVEAAEYVAQKIKRTQEILERHIAIENVSYYMPLSQELTEIDFILQVLTKADCDLLFDVNNLYVNSHNHHYDADVFLAQIPGDRIAYIHVAGHQQKKSDLIIDTHGAVVIDPVWALLKKTYQQLGVKPTILERDNNLPSLDEMLKELEIIKRLQRDTEAM